MSTKLNKKYWTIEEERFIKENISKMTIMDFSNYFNLPKNKIVDKIHKMHLNSKKATGIIWSQEEDKLLKEHFEYAPKHYIEKLFPNRSWNAIFQRGLKTLGLNRKSQDRYSINYNFFNKWTPESAYLVGLILADGYVYKKSNMSFLQIELQKSDIDILNKMKTVLEFEGNIKNSKTVKIQINNAKIIDDLIKKGIPVTNKSYVASFPRKLPKKFYKDFIRGVIDGDGWSTISHKENNRYCIGVCGTLPLVTSIKNILEKNFNINIKVSLIRNSCYRLNVKGKKGFQIAKWLYEDATIFLDRKYNSYKNSIKKYEFSVSMET